MTTSLAEQLQRLAVPQTAALKGDKKRASLLFDPKEAATLRRETIYQIGLEGYEDLKARSASFNQFANTLFNVTSKDFERSMHNAQANAVLDTHVRKFLLFLSPYFLLNCAHKALEWLIHRYHIHEYNRNDFLLLILPYHETNIFVRALQLVHLKDSNDSWFWLKSLQKPGIHLPKQSLYNHAASDQNFIKLISDHVVQAVRKHENPHVLSVLFNFYCLTFTGALEYSANVNEGQVTQMLRVLLKGTVSNVPDFCAGTYVIIAKLLLKTELSETLLTKFVDNITYVKVMRLKSEAVFLLVVLYQSQKQFTEMSPVAVRNLSEKPWLPKLLQELSAANNSVTPLLVPLFKGTITSALLEVASDRCKKFMQELLNEIKLDNNFVASLINMILDAYKPKKERYLKETEEWIKNFMWNIETKYPVAFDKEVNEIMKLPPGKPWTKRQKRFQRLLTDGLGLEDKVSLFRQLYHPVPSIRQDTMKLIIMKYKQLKERDREFFINVVLDKLQDDSCEVVRETLIQSKGILPELIDKKTMLDIFIKLLMKAQSHKDEWWQISHPVLEILCVVATDNDVGVFIRLLPFLLPTNKEELKAARVITNSPYADKSDFLRSLKDQLKQARTCETFFAVIFDGLSMNPDKAVIAALKEVPEKDRDTVHKYLATLLLCSSLHENCSAEVSLLVLDILLTYLQTSKLYVVKTELTISNYIISARRGMLPLQGFLHCIETIIFKTRVPERRLGLHDFSEVNDVSKFHSALLDILLRGCYSDKEKVSLLYAETLRTYFERFCVDFKTKIEYFLNSSVADSCHVSASMRLRCLHAATTLLSVKQENLLPLVDLSEVIVPFILISLMNSKKEIRLCAVELVQVVSSIVGGGYRDGSYALLLTHLLKRKEEIVLDEEQVSLVVCDILTNKKNRSQYQEVLQALMELTFRHDYPLYLKVGISKILTHMSDFGIYNKMATLAVDVIRQAEDPKEEFDRQKSILISNTIRRLDASIAALVKPNTQVYAVLEAALRSDGHTIKSDSEESLNLSVLAMNQMEPSVFDGLDSDVQEAVLNITIEVAATTQNPEVSAAAGHLFKHVDLDARSVLKQLSQMRDVQSPKLNPQKRKRRVSHIPTADILDTLDWKKGVTVLEFVQNKKKIKNASVLLPVMFDVLKKCLDFDEQANVEYPKQLILSCILNAYDKTAGETLPVNVFNMESVVQCIRASQNPQTHHHALLVLAHTSHLLPTQVLHHIMAIFTFMGSSVLRHDDAYSFQIINRIVDTVIPILVSDGGRESVVGVLRVFVDAILDVPEHRRIPLYKSLLERISAADNLYLFLLLVFEAHVLHAHTEKQKNAAKDRLASPKRLDVAADLTREFPSATVITTCIKLMEYLRGLPEDKEKVEENGVVQLLDVAHHTPKQFRHYKYVLVTFVVDLLSSGEFVNQIAALDNDKLLELEPLYKNMIINVLMYVQAVSRLSEKNSKTPQAQYWKVMLHHSYDILDSLNALLTPQMFLLVIRGLTTHNLNAIRRRSLELLNAKLQHNSSFFDDCEESELYGMIPSLVNIIKQVESPEVDSEQELIIQTALLSLKLFIKRLARDSPEKFVQILEFVTTLVKSGKVRGNILASMVLCLAELCSNLRAFAISSLSKFMPCLVKLLKTHGREDLPDLLLLSSLTALHKIVDSLPLFLSPYLQKLLCALSSIAAKWNARSEDPKLAPLVSKLGSITTKIGASIPPRILVPNIDGSYKSLVGKSKYSSVGPLMDVLTETLSNLKGPDIQAVLPDLTGFFLQALQFRSSDVQATVAETNALEAHVIKALVALILKLSESTFRPLYYKIYDWAVRSDFKSERVITFYSLSGEIAHSLKGLFVLFASHFLNNAAALLDACNTVKCDKLYFDEDDKNIMLIENVLKTLHAICLYDSQKFINRERFDVLMQPVVDQLENTLGGVDALVERGKVLITPCIVHFSVAIGDDALWKQLNYQVLLKTRHASPSLRLVALDCLCELAKKLGEDFLPLLPETIPFLAELLEDDEESVEKACQKAVQDLERVLGEPLQKYF